MPKLIPKAPANLRHLNLASSINRSHMNHATTEQWVSFFHRPAVASFTVRQTREPGDLFLNRSFVWFRLARMRQMPDAGPTVFGAEH